MSKRLIITVSLILSAVGSAHLLCQTTKTSSSSIASSSLTRDRQLESTAADAAADLLRDAGVYGGIVVVDSCSSPEKYHVSYSQGESLDRALNYLSSTTGKYKWEVTNDVVDVLPVGAVPELLNLRVAQFDWDTTDAGNGVLPRLMQTPEVSRALKGFGLERGPYLGGAGVACISDGKVGSCERAAAPAIMHERDATVREILNRIAKYGHTIWLYRERQCGGAKTFTVDLIAQ
jgi:hypothetical protein